MKPRIQWVATLVIAASAGMAFGCGCPTRLAPVRERFVEERSTLDWGAPFRTVGTVISAPFVALGDALSPSDRYIEPVGERMTYRSTWTRSHTQTLMPVGERVVTVKHHHKRMLKPVGERIIVRTTRVYSQPYWCY